MDLGLLVTLKNKLAEAKNFTEILTYFLDHFGHDPAFIALGERTKQPFLEAVLLQVGQQLFQGNVVIVDLILTRLAEHQFIHGGCILNSCMANVLYFENIHQGLIAVATPKETQFARFAGRPMPRRQEPSTN